MSGVIFRQIRVFATRISWRHHSSQSGKHTNAEVITKRNQLYEAERERQASLITRVEKIQVNYKGLPEECTLLMNKNLSTPFNCAMHISELLMQRSVLALVNGEPWDMHRPLVEDCDLHFLHFKENDPSLVNRTFWRTGSFILGHILETAFKDSFYVQLCSFPKPNIHSGSFVYDVDLGIDDWRPSSAELNCLSRIGSRLNANDTRIERLEVDASVAQNMFEDNRFKSAQIPSIAAGSTSGNSVTLYRMGSHIDISGGPLMASTSLIGRFAVTAVHDLDSPDFGKLKRVQGLATPWQLPIHYWSYEKLCIRSAKLNPASVPTLTAPQTTEVPTANSHPV